MKNALAVWGVSLFVASTAHAQAPGDPLFGKVALGYLATSGNTESTNANTGFQLDWAPNGTWSYQFAATAVGASRDRETTSEAYQAGAKALREYSEANYFFAAVEWKKDRFSGYQDQISESLGYGRRIIESPRQQLNAEIGAGARQSTLATGEGQNEAILRSALNYVFTISETSDFNQRVLIEAGEDNTYSESISRLSTRVMDDVALILSYTVRYNSDVPVDRENQDTFTSIALEYAF
jgi:putative salt-induced outer membrane protein